MITSEVLIEKNIISEDKLLELLKPIKYGSLTFILQDGIVIQIELKEKLKLK